MTHKMELKKLLECVTLALKSPYYLTFFAEIKDGLEEGQSTLDVV